EVDKATKMPSNASIVALFFNVAWLFYFFMANLTPFANKNMFLFDSTELPLICVYAFYIPVYIMLMVKGKDLGAFKRFIMPVFSIAGAALFIYAAITKHGIMNLGFLAVAAVIMIIGALLRKSGSEQKAE
ncbi:MAG: amino acid permease, partial [Clostridia bacterium]|nr:amino acid permease [Clostridia bacterium]